MTNRITPELSERDRPRNAEGVHYVECVKGGESQAFVVYGKSIKRVEMHWDAKKRRTNPCFKDHSLCPGGHDEKTLKWRGYVWAYSESKRKPVWIQLTDDACESWFGQLNSGQQIQGQRIIVHRSKKDNGRLWVEVDQYKFRDVTKAPPEPDLRPSLFRLWNFDPAGVHESASFGSTLEILKNGTGKH